MRFSILLLFTVITFGQQTSKVDFKTVYGNISISGNEGKVSGTVRYIFEVKDNIDTIKIDGKKMEFKEVKINDKWVKFNSNDASLSLFEGYKKGKNTLTFSYSAFPKQTMYFNGAKPTQIWTQGQGKYTSHWFPSFDNVNEKVIFNMNITYDEGFVVLSNGVLKDVYSFNTKKIWKYEMNKPMSSYLLVVAIGNYVNKTIASKSGIPIQLFIQPKDTSKFESTYRYSKEIFDYLEHEIGVKYPWKIYKQIPVEDFLYAGMENTSATLFAQDFVIDSVGFNDRNYVSVNAHELAHQWFGNLVTAKSGKHHWLQEGFATYFALLAEKKLFGDDYFYYQLYRNSLQLKNAAKTDTLPVLNEKASSLSFYQKGAWALHVIREAIGEKNFQKVIKNFINKYQFQNAETDDFLAEVSKVSDFDTETFKKVWLEDYHFRSDEVNGLLVKNKSIQLLLEVQKMRSNSIRNNYNRYSEILQSDVFYPVKTEIIYQLKDVPYEDKKDLLKMALDSNNINVRQAVAEFAAEIPYSFKTVYETLLKDASYDTKEIAFMNLWKNFPESRNDYLVKAQNWIGGNDKSLRLLYLTFSIQNQSLDSQSLYEELLDYTSPKYESSIRQNAFVNVLTINDNDPIVLKNLVNATTHYKWQFSKFARDTIKNLLLAGAKPHFVEIYERINDKEKVQLDKLFQEKK